MATKSFWVIVLPKSVMPQLGSGAVLLAPPVNVLRGRSMSGNICAIVTYTDSWVAMETFHFLQTLHTVHPAGRRSLFVKWYLGKQEQH